MNRVVSITILQTLRRIKRLVRMSGYLFYISSNEYPQSMFWAETRKISEFFISKFSFFGGKIFSMFE